MRSLDPDGKAPAGAGPDQGGRGRGATGFTLVLCLLLAVVSLTAVWMVRAGASEGEETLESKIHALELLRMDDQRHIMGLQDQVARLSPELEESATDLESAERTIKVLQNRMKELEQESRERRERVWELQRLLLTRPSDRTKHNQPLQALWPLIEQRAPSMVARYRRVFSNFGPDGFISQEFEPKPLSAEVITENRTGGYTEGPDRLYGFGKGVVPSPDRTRLIWTCVEECDVDTEIDFVDAKARFYWRLDMQGPSGGFLELTWLDNETFMYVNYFYQDRDRVSTWIYVYRAAPDVMVSLIGVHEAPAMTGAEWEQWRGAEVGR